MGLRYDLPTLYQNSPGNMSNFYPNLDELVVLKGHRQARLVPWRTYRFRIKRWS